VLIQDECPKTEPNHVANDAISWTPTHTTVKRPQTGLTNAENIFPFTSYAETQESSILASPSFKNGHETNNIFDQHYNHSSLLKAHTPSADQHSPCANHGSYICIYSLWGPIYITIIGLPTNHSHRQCIPRWRCSKMCVSSTCRSTTYLAAICERIPKHGGVRDNKRQECNSKSGPQYWPINRIKDPPA
jgi:hypothetical protein